MPAGSRNFGGQIAGAVAPAVMGWLIAHLNQTFTPAFMFLIGSGVLSFVVALTLLDRHKPTIFSGVSPAGENHPALNAKRPAASRGALFDDGGAMGRLIGRPTTPMESLVATALRG
jgi:hypothetical protein